MKRTKYQQKKKQIEFSLPDIGIPAEILFNYQLTLTDKILFGFIRNLAQGPNGCWASNNYLGKLLKRSPSTISESLSKLERFCYIDIDLGGDSSNSRKIYINPEYKILYQELVKKTHETLSTKPRQFTLSNNVLKERIIRKNQKGGTEKPEGGVLKNQKEIKEIKEKEKEKKNICFYSWKDLEIKYGTSQCDFVAKVLRQQKEQYPNLIKEDISYDSPRVIHSLEELERLQRIDGFDFDTEIQPTIEAAVKDEFWGPRVLSFTSLRTKSSNGNKKFENMVITLMNGKHKETKKPEEIIAEKAGNDVSSSSILSIYSDASKLVRLYDNDDKVDLAENLCDMVQWLLYHQKRPSFQQGKYPDTDPRFFILKKWKDIPRPLAIVKRYLHWLENSNWINTKDVRVFRYNHKLFKMFLNDLSKNVGSDVLTGRDVS